MSYSAWDTSGPSQIADPSFYLPEHRRGRGKAPNLTRGVRAKAPQPAKVPKRNLEPLDVEAVRNYIALGHTTLAASKHFHRCEKTIRAAVGSVLQYRKELPKHPHPKMTCYGINMPPEMYEWVQRQGGAKFMRDLIASRMGAA